MVRVPEPESADRGNCLVRPLGPGTPRVLTFKLPADVELRLREYLALHGIKLAQFMREAVDCRLGVGAGPGGGPPAQAPPEQGTRADASALRSGSGTA